MFSVSKAEHASSTGPTACDGGWGVGGEARDFLFSSQTSCGISTGTG